MKNLMISTKFQFLWLSLFVLLSCGSENQSIRGVLTKVETPAHSAELNTNFNLGSILGMNPQLGCQGKRFPGMCQDTSRQIADYVRRIFQDKKGHLWFGTNAYGLCRFDGKAVDYISVEDGLGGTQITGILEDKNDHLWFTTNGGVAKYDGEKITNYTTEDGLSHNWVWSILEDKEGVIWVGTIDGLCRFDGTGFKPFLIPKATVAQERPRFSTDLVKTMLQDKAGNMWFGIDGLGVCKYDGKNYTHYTKEDGLCGNNITCIVEDQKGNFWFGSMFGGLSRFDGTTFTNFNDDTVIGDNEVWHIYEDKKGRIWFSSEGFGVYRYDGNSFVNFFEEAGLHVAAVQTIYEDKTGQLWVGGGGGLYRYDGDASFINVTQAGPWH